MTFSPGGCPICGHLEHDLQYHVSAVGVNNPNWPTPPKGVPDHLQEWNLFYLMKTHHVVTITPNADGTKTVIIKPYPL